MGNVRLGPGWRLEHAKQAATSVAWAGGELLALGAARGWIGVWKVGAIFRSQSPPSKCGPDYIVRAHRSAVESHRIMDLSRSHSYPVARPPSC